MIRFSGYGTILALIAAAVASDTSAARAQSFRIDDAVEIEASDHWVPCVVIETAPPGETMRVRCTPYPQLSRDGGIYRVTNRPDHIRKAGIGQPSGAPGSAGPGTAPASAVGSASPTSGGGGLNMGEHACYGGSTGSGSGQVAGGRSQLLAGLAFHVRPGGRYVDADEANPGTCSVSGSTVTFHGGIHGGQTGTSLRNGTFVLGSRVYCEPW
ncbi:hypothetical protein ABIE65_004737 [Constrictibacter sp. MBR-5]|jgi:hypothetical protein|uniref:hypothetical protein n=1 Tax=Constrictibacter sp. MBR-5 TaxID=3156467 RepID=UPI0033976626